MHNHDTPLTSIEKEFAGAKLGDRRRNARLLKIAGRLADDPSVSFPKAFDESELEGAYRFFSSDDVDPDAVLEPHIQQTLERTRNEPLTLVLHDSSKFSFGSEGHRQGLSESTGGHQHFLSHVSLAVSGDGSRRPHGVLAVSRHVVGQARKKQGRKRTGRLQDRWTAHIDRVHELGLDPQRTVHVMDRESDDYDVFSCLAKHGARFVVRMQHNRSLLEGDHLRNRLPEVPMLVTQTVRLGHRGGHKGAKQKRIHPPREERTATLAVGGMSVQFERPSTASPSSPPCFPLNVVYVRELDPPDPQSAVEWVLLTNEPVDTAEQLLHVIDCYRARWVIEEFFKALKSGCSLEKRQLGTLHALSNALAVLLPLAWRLLLLRTEARERPDAPASTVLSQDEIQILRVAGRKPLPESPTVRDALLAIAALGGHLKRNGEPGWQTLGRGYEKLQTLTLGWRLRAATVAERYDQS